MEQVKNLKRFTVIYLFICLASAGFTGCASLLELDQEAGAQLSGSGDEEMDRGFAQEKSDERDSQEEGRLPSPRLRLSKSEKRVQSAIDTRDIVLGMDRYQVQSSWGSPTSREVAGSGREGHERWRYGSRYSLQGERVVVFENGKVIGWYR
jgi:hypothetical protein